MDLLVVEVRLIGWAGCGVVSVGEESVPGRGFVVVDGLDVGDVGEADGFGRGERGGGGVIVVGAERLLEEGGGGDDAGTF